MPGGVCAVLDYEVEHMAEYVAEMATRVVAPDAGVTASFRKFVSQILSSTRLPSTTIMLGMNYLAKRVNTLRSEGSYTASEGQIWRYLTVSLLLGSKFLDDNTFQNRSWSEVSGIAVSELNTLEFQWVQSMDWRLYVNLDLSKDYNAWLENWHTWEVARKRQSAQANRERLASLVPAIDTEVARHSSQRHSTSRYMREQVAEYERYQAIRAQQQSYRPREPAWGQNPWSAPITPPDSGYGTPDYMMSATSSNAQYNDWFAQAAAQYNSRPYHASARGGYYQHRQSHHYHTPYGYGQGAWEHGVAECSCHGCVAPMKQNPYLASHAYTQPVGG